MSDYIEIVFKGERKEIFANPQQFPFKPGDYAIVEAARGEDLGVVNQVGPLIDRKAAGMTVRNILRKPSPADMERYRANREKEAEAFQLCKQKIAKHGLAMKLVDVEFQFDCHKITFYFTAEKRVDFRELVKDLAAEYRVRIELRQIGVRDEARRIGGFGACGRQLCCNTFLREFEPVTTQCAKEQNLPLNPQKLSGMCGRLLCCLVYERQFYKEALASFPEVGSLVKTSKGTGVLEKVDIFRERVHIRYEDQSTEILTRGELEKCQVVAKGEKSGKKKK